MAFTLYSLLKAALLVLNALAVLHPHRFLKNCAYAATAYSGCHLPYLTGAPQLRSRLAHLIPGTVVFDRHASRWSWQSARRRRHQAANIWNVACNSLLAMCVWLAIGGCWSDLSRFLGSLHPAQL